VVAWLSGLANVSSRPDLAGSAWSITTRTLWPHLKSRDCAALLTVRDVRAIWRLGTVQMASGGARKNTLTAWLGIDHHYCCDHLPSRDWLVCVVGDGTAGARLEVWNIQFCCAFVPGRKVGQSVGPSLANVSDSFFTLPTGTTRQLFEGSGDILGRLVRPRAVGCSSLFAR
jgi:hypothetical protein